MYQIFRNHLKNIGYKKGEKAKREDGDCVDVGRSKVGSKEGTKEGGRKEERRKEGRGGEGKGEREEEREERRKRGRGLITIMTLMTLNLHMV